MEEQKYPPVIVEEYTFGCDSEKAIEFMIQAKAITNGLFHDRSIVYLEDCGNHFGKKYRHFIRLNIHL